MMTLFATGAISLGVYMMKDRHEPTEEGVAALIIGIVIAVVVLVNV